jgi:predicted nucleotidyltransferase
MNDSFLSRLEELFYTEMDQHTSACLYGSAVTGNWIAGRSDLDLLVIVPEEKNKAVWGKNKGMAVETHKSNPRRIHTFFIRQCDTSQGNSQI